MLSVVVRLLLLGAVVLLLYCPSAVASTRTLRFLQLFPCPPFPRIIHRSPPSHCESHPIPPRLPFSLLCHTMQDDPTSNSSNSEYLCRRDSESRSQMLGWGERLQGCGMLSEGCTGRVISCGVLAECSNHWQERALCSLSWSELRQRESG